MLWGQEFSLYSSQALSEREHRSLLVQFLLFETIEAYRAAKVNCWEEVISCHPRSFPYDWAKSAGHCNKLYEHSLLLKKSFSDHARRVKKFEKVVSKVLGEFAKARFEGKNVPEGGCSRLYHALEPLIEVCKESENLLFFLLKNRKVIDELKGSGYLHTFILKMHREGLEMLGEKMCDQYHQRGFFSQIPEFKHLLAQLLHA